MVILRGYNFKVIIISGGISTIINYFMVVRIIIIILFCGFCIPIIFTNYIFILCVRIIILCYGYLLKLSL